MGYTLRPRNKELDSFHFGAFSFPLLLEACGYMFPCVHTVSRWYRVCGIDSRFENKEYPEIIIMGCGFRVAAEEARWMWRVARNLVAVQRSLPEPPMDETGQPTWEYIAQSDNEWPRWIRRDFVDLFDKFTDWANRSRGFRIF